MLSARRCRADRIGPLLPQGLCSPRSPRAQLSWSLRGCDACRARHTGAWQTSKRHYKHCEKRCPPEGVHVERNFALGVRDTPLRAETTALLLSDSTLITGKGSLEQVLTTPSRDVMVCGGATIGVLGRFLKGKRLQDGALDVCAVIASGNDWVAGSLDTVVTADVWSNLRHSVVAAVADMAREVCRVANRGVYVIGSGQMWKLQDAGHAARYDEYAAECAAAARAEGLSVIRHVEVLANTCRLTRDGTAQICDAPTTHHRTLEPCKICIGIAHTLRDFLWTPAQHIHGTERNSTGNPC